MEAGIVRKVYEQPTAKLNGGPHAFLLGDRLYTLFALFAPDVPGRKCLRKESWTPGKNDKFCQASRFIFNWGKFLQILRRARIFVPAGFFWAPTCFLRALWRPSILLRFPSGKYSRIGSGCAPYSPKGDASQICGFSWAREFKACNRSADQPDNIGYPQVKPQLFNVLSLHQPVRL